MLPFACCNLYPLLLMSGFKFGFNLSGENRAGDTRNEANDCAAAAAAPAIEVAVPATLAAPIGPLQDVALGSDVLIRLRVRGHGHGGMPSFEAVVATSTTLRMCCAESQLRLCHPYDQDP